MPKYVASRELLWSIDVETRHDNCWTRKPYIIKQIVLPEGTRDSSFIVEYEAGHYWPDHYGNLKTNTPEDGWCGFTEYIEGMSPQLYSGTVSDSGPMSAITIWLEMPPMGCCRLTIRNVRIYGSKVYSGTCQPFFWIGDVFITIGQILRSVGDRMGTVWFVGDVIQTWFNTAAGYFEGARDWFYSLGDWCGQIVQGLQLGDAWTWLLGFFADPAAEIYKWLGTAWTDLQDMYANFNMWVTNALGSTWTWVLGLYSDFSGAVTSILGDAWTWVLGLYSDFSGAVTSILGDTWTWVLGLYGDFTGAVTGALGGTWTWLTEFINDPMSKLNLDMLDLVKSGFEWLTQEWFSFIDSTWDTFKGSFTWLMQKFFLLLDESWDTFEDSMKWLVGKVLDLVGDKAEDFKDKIWEMIEKVVKKL